MDLTKVETDDLLDEISSRYQASAFLLLADLLPKNDREADDGGAERARFVFAGGRYTCIGLAHHFINFAEAIVDP